jgi:hypothetical protein
VIDHGGLGHDIKLAIAGRCVSAMERRRTEYGASEAPVKISRNPEAAWKRIFSSENHIKISKIFAESPDFRADDRPDFLGQMARSSRCISFELQMGPTFMY